MREPLRALWLVGGLAFTLGALTVAGALLGHYLDQRLHTGPWLTLAGTLAGTAAGFFEMVTTLRRMSDRERGQ